jgi:hypothetical protein
VDSVRDGEPACVFCDGTGLWPDPEGDPDPCPLCEGTAVIVHRAPTGDELPGSEAALARLLVLLPRLSQRERQRLYEELHARYDCRIYR